MLYEILAGNKVLALAAVITLGLLLGRIRIAGLSLGSSGVIFSALLFGHYGIPILDGVGTLGVVIFVYCVGLGAGPSFFRVFVHQGKTLAKLGIAIVASGAASTWLLSTLAHIPPDLAAGVFAGAMTSTPALAAASEALPAGSRVAVGYGIAYPFGVVGVVLFVQLLPRLLRIDLDTLSRVLKPESHGRGAIVRRLVEVMNPAVIGQPLSELQFMEEANCQVSRILQGDRLVPVSPDFRLDAGQHVLVIGQEGKIDTMISLLGKASQKKDYIMDTERERMLVVVTSRNIVGRTLGELKLLSSWGVTISRILRHNIQFVPSLDEEIEYGDSLTVVGEPENIERFMDFAGHRQRTADETDLASLGIGLISGVLLGMVAFELGGKFSLGTAGGPLLMGLILGHFGKIGPVVGHLPRAANILLLEVGLVLFLADAGVKAGITLVPVVTQYGAAICVFSMLVVLIPMGIGYLLSRFALKMNFLQALGAICGGMTCTPGLGIITSKTDSEIPVVSYAAVYPVALILMTVFAPLLVKALG